MSERLVSNPKVMLRLESQGLESRGLKNQGLKSKLE
jgi:hypothetical protein